MSSRAQALPKLMTHRAVAALCSIDTETLRAWVELVKAVGWDGD